MTREELIKKVALKMDEISSSDDVIVPVHTGDNNPLYTQINNLLNESVNDVLMKAPLYRIHSHVVEAELKSGDDNLSITNIFDDYRKIATISVPSDFIRFVSISDDAFQRPVSELAMEGDTMDKRQHNRHLVAKYAKPVAVMGSNSSGRIITCYSYETDATPNLSFLYVKRYNNDEVATAETDLDGYMIDLVSWVCAGKVFAAQGDINKGKICDDNASALML